MSDRCPFPNGGPPLNQDIAGTGVRISFYLQTLFLACLSARSHSIGEINGSLYTLIVTNIAMAVSALILGLQPNTGISFHDGVVVFYLLYLSWVTVFFALPSCNRFPEAERFSRNVRMVKLFSVVQSYTVFAFALTLLIKAASFGTNPACNENAVVVLFRPFSALHAGRIVCWILTVAIMVVYTFLILKDHLPSPLRTAYQRVRKISMYRPSVRPRAPEPILSPVGRPINVQFAPSQPYSVPAPSKPADEESEHDTYELPVAWDLVIELVIVAILWSLTVMNTELLITWNNFAPASSTAPSPWQFGQVLPMFLVILPLFNMVNAFWEHRLRPIHRH